MSEQPSGATFHGLGIDRRILSILDTLGFTTPTPIQEKAIPVAVKGADVIGLAQTGTGKTLAFGVPMIQHLITRGGRALILLPTRELALQVDETLVKLGHPLGINTAVLIGGASLEKQRAQLRQKPQILVATPGRLIDHLQTGSVRLDAVNCLVLDEADRMFDMGFAPQIKRILEHVPLERQTMMFSATMPAEVEELVRLAMRMPTRIEIARVGLAAENVSQEIYITGDGEKAPLLESLLQKYTGTVIVFSRTKSGAKRLTRSLEAAGHSVTELHANRSLAQRREAMDGFKKGKYRILVATDIAARGIDVSDIQLVVNFDLPDVPEEYVHRIGRTGRAGKSGHAISFAAPDQGSELQAIERVLGRPIPRAEGHDGREVRVLSRNELRNKRRERDGVRNQRSSGMRTGAVERPNQDRADRPVRDDRPARENRERRPYPPRPNTNTTQPASAERPPRRESTGERPPRRDGDRRDRRDGEPSGPALPVNSAPKGFNGPRRVKRR